MNPLQKPDSLSASSTSSTATSSYIGSLFSFLGSFLWGPSKDDRIANLVKKIEEDMLGFACAAKTFRDHPEAFSHRPDKYQKCTATYSESLDKKENEIGKDIQTLDDLAKKVDKRAIDFFPQGRNNKYIRNFLEYAPFKAITRDGYVDYYEILGIASEDKKQIKQEICKKADKELSEWLKRNS